MMARYTWEQASNSTATVFSDWLRGVHAGMLAAGWVQTSDTGQVDAASYNGTASTAVYEVWRLDDAMQATFPIYAKVGYQTSGGSSVRLLLTLGSGSDGAGNITGNFVAGDPLGLGAGVIYAVMGGLSTAIESYYMAGDGSGVVYTGRTANTTASNRAGFFIDRTRDADGTPNANGVVWATSGTSGSFQYMYARSATRASTATLSYLGPGLATEFPWYTSGTSMETSGGSAPVIPLRFFTPEVNYLRMIAMLPTDAAHPAVISTDLLGVASTDLLAVGTQHGTPWLAGASGGPTVGFYYDA